MYNLLFGRVTIHVVALFFISLATVNFSSDSKSKEESAYQLVLQLMQAADYPKAFAECQRLISHTPEHELAYSRLPEIALQAGMVTEAVTFLQNSSAVSPKAAAYRLYALALTKSLQPKLTPIDHQQIIEASQRSIALAPTFIRPYPLLIEASLALGQKPQLETYLTNLAPDNAATYHALGYFYKVTGRYKEGVAAFEKALQLAPELLEALYEKGATILRSQRPETRPQGLAWGKELAARAETQNNAEQKIKALKLIGYAYSISDQPGEAVTHYLRGLRLAETNGELVLQAYFRSSLCSNFGDLDDYGKQLFVCRQALAMPFTKNKEYDLANIGVLYRRMGNTLAGIAAYEEALKLARQKNNQTPLMLALTNLGEAYADTEVKRYAESRTLLNEAYQLAVQLKDQERQCRALASLGLLAFRQNQYQQAINRQEKAVELARQGGYKYQEGRSLNSLGIAYAKMGQWEKALQTHHAAQRIGQEVAASRTVWLAHSGMADVYRQRQQPEQAKEQLRLAIQQLEKTRPKINEEENRIGFWQDKIKLYKDLVALLLNPAESHLANPNKRPSETEQAEAFHLIERGRARALLDLLAAPPTTAAGGVNTTGQDNPVQYQEAQPFLDEQTAILSYSLGEKASFLFVIERERLAVYRLASEAALNKHLSVLLKSAADPYQSEQKLNQFEASELYRLLILPAETQLAGKTHLIISADGVLQRLPFHILVKPPRPAASKASRPVPYLLRDFAVSYTPSVSSWVCLNKNFEAPVLFPKELAAFGDPAYSTETANQASLNPALLQSPLDALPFSRVEVNKIAALFPKEKVDLFLGTEANEQNVRAVSQSAQYRIIHFSAHATMNEAIPGYSALLLSSPLTTTLTADTGNDGILTANEILKLRLKAELVVLSACETGLGKDVKGEGLMGLMRSWLHAGTPSVVMSLWKIDDRATTDLMAKFYGYYLNGKQVNGHFIKLSKAQALQQAQLDMLEKNTDVYYWGSFVIAGR